MGKLRQKARGGSLAVQARVRKPRCQSLDLALSKNNVACKERWIKTMAATARSTIDQSDVDRFSRIASEWWDPRGKFRPLHKFNPTRLDYIREQVSATFGRNLKSAKPFEGLRLLDIGCGGGLLCEPMARLGANVVGADASATNIEVAKLHAAQSGVTIDYRATTSEALSEAGETFDIILNMEVVEHVADVELYLQSCAKMLRPGGLMFIATINRTMKAYALAIVGAEYVLGWLPKGTHSYDKLVRPEEIEAALAPTGVAIIDRLGVTFNPLTDKWSRSNDIAVNYMMLVNRPK
jgi:2-polyprenyl-6-hydroxyphenyl methylase / 3-demethylubiquinone-9 3-methyltransferase